MLPEGRISYLNTLRTVESRLYGHPCFQGIVSEAQSFITNFDQNLQYFIIVKDYQHKIANLSFTINVFFIPWLINYNVKYM